MVNHEVLSAFKISLTEILETEKDKPLFGPNRRDLKKVVSLTRALRNPAILEKLAEKYESEITIMASEITEEDGRFFKIIQWIIENQDSILKFILALIEIFG